MNEDPTLTTFRDLGISHEIADAIESAGITHPFPIQEMTLPIAMLGMDVIGQARTGTGKTLAFGIPVLERIVSPRDPAYSQLVTLDKPQALIVVPTRELALQVSGDIKLAGSRTGTRLTTVYGGRAYEPQIEALRRGVDVVVGTPGRLLDLADQGHLDLSQVKILVLDEADEMLDLGFLPDVEKIIGRTPENRQTLLFSATMPTEVVGLARRYLRQATNIRAEAAHETITVPQTVQHVFRVHPLDKDEVVARLLQAEDRGLTMIFSRTKRSAQRLADDLSGRGFAVAAVHGDLGQAAREQALRAFRKGKVDVLVATDVAARGIDVEGVTHVVNYQCPEDETTYLHRIGRTGRAGASGVAVTLVGWDELARWSHINKELGLSFDEPLETYSTSEHLFDMLGIPASAGGILPVAMRERAGLDAEQVEDLDGRKRRRRRRGQGGQPKSDDPGRDRHAKQGTHRAGREPAGEPDSRGSGAKGRRADAATRGAAGADSDRQPTGSEQPRRRHRRRLRRGKPIRADERVSSAESADSGGQ